MSVAKVGLIGAVSAVGATGTYFLVWGGDPMPSSKTLLDITSDKTKYNDKIGNQYQHFLVAPFEEENKNWWEWSHRRWNYDLGNDDSKSVSGEFTKEKIEGAFDKSEADTMSSSPSPTKKPLNKVCEEVYKKAKSDVAIDGDDTNKKNLMSDMWKYCSILRERPKTIEEAGQSTTSQKIGDTNKTKLISTTYPKNDEFWKKKGEWFKSLNISDTNNYFKNNVGTEEGKKSLKEVCEGAYGETSGSGGTSPSNDEVIKYCSLDTAQPIAASR